MKERTRVFSGISALRGLVTLTPVIIGSEGRGMVGEVIAWPLTRKAGAGGLSWSLEVVLRVLDGTSGGGRGRLLGRLLRGLLWMSGLGGRLLLVMLVNVCPVH